MNSKLLEDFANGMHMRCVWDGIWPLVNILSSGSMESQPSADFVSCNNRPAGLGVPYECAGATPESAPARRARHRVEPEVTSINARINPLTFQ